jgi:hypothetical protein
LNIFHELTFLIDTQLDKIVKNVNSSLESLLNDIEGLQAREPQKRRATSSKKEPKSKKARRQLFPEKTQFLDTEAIEEDDKGEWYK